MIKIEDHIEIEEELYLDLIQDHHFDEFFQLVEDNRGYLRRWLSWVDITKTHDQKRRLFNIFQKRFDEHDIATYIIRYQSKIIGSLGYNEINWDKKHASFGYWIDEAHRGKGLILKCCDVFIQYGFKYLELELMEIRCGEFNYPSQRIPEKLGFAFNGMIEHGEWFNNHYINLKSYLLKKEDWIPIRVESQI